MQTLDLIREQCCDGDAGPCTGVLADITNDRKYDVCSSPGNHCDADGEITHLDLSESNMKCDLADAEFPLIEMKKLQACPSCSWRPHLTHTSAELLSRASVTTIITHTPT